MLQQSLDHNNWHTPGDTMKLGRKTPQQSNDANGDNPGAVALAES